MTSRFIVPCEPTLRDRLPKGEGWLYEVKYDGYRMQVHKEGAVSLYTRRGADFPHLVAALGSLPGSAIIDAELVHPDGFEALHSAVHGQVGAGLTLWGFDLMAQNGNDLRSVALEDRKRRLGLLIDRANIAQLMHSGTLALMPCLKVSWRIHRCAQASASGPRRHDRRVVTPQSKACPICVEPCSCFKCEIAFSRSL